MSTHVEGSLHVDPSATPPPPATLSPPAPLFAPAPGDPAGTWVDDTHARVNRTRVRRVERPTTTAALARLVRRAAAAGEQLSIAGGRHAMGGQAFASGGVLIDTTGLDRVLALDPVRGTVRAQAA
jgi:FAD/FMN-containing dehydrogenase